MFIKVPVYFEISGSFKELGFVQEVLQTYLEKTLLGRKASEVVNLDWKKALPEGSGYLKEVKLIRREKVIDGLK